MCSLLNQFYSSELLFVICMSPPPHKLKQRADTRFQCNCVVLCNSVVLCINCVVLCIVCAYMCTVLLPPGVNPVAVNKYIYIYVYM